MSMNSLLQSSQILPTVQHGDDQNEFVTDQVIHALGKTLHGHSPYSVKHNPIGSWSEPESIEGIFNFRREITAETFSPSFVPTKSGLHFQLGFRDELHRVTHFGSRRLAFTSSQVKVFCGSAS